MECETYTLKTDECVAQAQNEMPFQTFKTSADVCCGVSQATQTSFGHGHVWHAGLVHHNHPQL